MFQITTGTETSDNEFAQSSYNHQSLSSTSARTNLSFSSMTDTNETRSNVSIHESKKAKRNKRYKAKKNKKKGQSIDLTVQNNESVAINVNIQDTVLKRTLKKTSFMKNKKMKC